jgi:NAD(P)-dependent dehydrogenase (short-subunit alcohol dehydrogenase family)
MEAGVHHGRGNIVIGGNGGIGRGIAIGLAEAGAADVTDSHRLSSAPSVNLEVGRHALADLLTERPHLRRQRHQRRDIAPRPDCRQQHAHEKFLKSP